MSPFNSKVSASRAQKKSTTSFSARSRAVVGGERGMHRGTTEISNAPNQVRTRSVSFASTSTSWTSAGQPTPPYCNESREAEATHKRNRNGAVVSSSRSSPAPPVSKKKSERGVPTFQREDEKGLKSRPPHPKQEEEDVAAQQRFSDLSSVLPVSSLSPRAERRLFTVIQATPCLPAPESPLLTLPLPLLPQAADVAPEKETSSMDSLHTKADRPSPCAYQGSSMGGRHSADTRGNEGKQTYPTDTGALHPEGENRIHKQQQQQQQDSGVAVEVDPRRLPLPEHQEKLVWTLSSALHAVYLITMTERAQRGSSSGMYKKESENGSTSDGMHLSSPPLASVLVNGRWLDGVSQFLHCVPLTMDDLARLSQLFPQWLRIQWSTAPVSFDARPSFSSPLSLGGALPLSGSPSLSSSSPPPLLQARLYLTANHVISIEEAAASLRERMMCHAAVAASHEGATTPTAPYDPSEASKRETTGKTEKESIGMKRSSPAPIAHHATRVGASHSSGTGKEMEHGPTTEGHKIEFPLPTPIPSREHGASHPLQGVVTAYQAFLAQQQNVSSPSLSSKGPRETQGVPSTVDAAGNREGQVHPPLSSSSSSASLSMKEEVPLVHSTVDPPTVLPPTPLPLPSSSSASSTMGALGMDEEYELSSVLSPALRQSLSKEKLAHVLAQLRREQSGEARRQYEAICDRRVQEDMLRMYVKIRSAMGRRRMLPVDRLPITNPTTSSLLSRQSAATQFGKKKVHMSLTQLMTYLRAEKDLERSSGDSFQGREALGSRDGSGETNVRIEGKGEVNHLLKTIEALVRIPSSGLRLQHFSGGFEDQKETKEVEEEKKGKKVSCEDDLRCSFQSASIPPLETSAVSSSSCASEETKRRQYHPHTSAIPPSETMVVHDLRTSPSDSFSLVEIPPEEWHRVILFLDQSVASVKELAVAVETV